MDRKSESEALKCQHCSKSSEVQKLLKCSRCKAARYCNKECQRLDWKVHRHQCSTFKTGRRFVKGRRLKTHSITAALTVGLVPNLHRPTRYFDWIAGNNLTILGSSDIPEIPLVPTEARPCVLNIMPWGLDHGMDLGLFVQIYSLPAGPGSDIQTISYNVIRNIKQGLCRAPGTIQFYGAVMYNGMPRVLAKLEEAKIIQQPVPNVTTRVLYDSIRTGEKYFELPLYEVNPVFCLTGDESLTRAFGTR